MVLSAYKQHILMMMIIHVFAYANSEKISNLVISRHPITRDFTGDPKPNLHCSAICRTSTVRTSLTKRIKHNHAALTLIPCSEQTPFMRRLHGHQTLLSW